MRGRLLWESAKQEATEGANSKKTLGINLSGKQYHNRTQLWRERICNTPPTGKTL